MQYSNAWQTHPKRQTWQTDDDWINSQLGSPQAGSSSWSCQFGKDPQKLPHLLDPKNAKAHLLQTNTLSTLNKPENERKTSRSINFWSFNFPKGFIEDHGISKQAAKVSRSSTSTMGRKSSESFRRHWRSSTCNYSRIERIHHILLSYHILCIQSTQNRTDTEVGTSSRRKLIASSGGVGAELTLAACPGLYGQGAYSSKDCIV